MAACKCGCGTELPKGSRLAYIRGHRKAQREKDAKDYIDSLKEQERKEGKIDGGIFEPPTGDVFDGLPRSWDAMQNPFEAMRDNLPDDPEPDFKARDVAAGIIQPDGQIVVTKKIAADIQGKVAFLLSMPASMLATVDPICFPQLLQQTPEISAALTPIICQSPDMVKFFTKGGGFILWLNLAVSVWPVVQVVIAHHVTKKVGHDDQGNIVEKDFSQYRVQAK